jgi:signal transduction histidine kinase
MLAWAADPRAALRRLRSWEGGLLLVSVTTLSALGISTDEPVTYLIFPGLIWAAFRFGPPGATISIAIAALVAIGVTANDVGPFSKQMIDHQTLSTQLYIAVAALTTLLLSAVVSERERSAVELAEAKRREDLRATEERHRIARDLHDSVSQTLFSTTLHTRAAQKAVQQGDLSEAGPLGRALSAIVELTKSAQGEMRALIFELGRDSVEGGLVLALDKHAARLAARDGLTIEVLGPKGRLPLSAHAETQVLGIAREALANVVKHADADAVRVQVAIQPGRVLVEIHDDGRGFDAAAGHPGHFGLESMRSRAAEIGGHLRISSTPGQGTTVRVEAPVETEGATNGF